MSRFPSHPLLNDEIPAEIPAWFLKGDTFSRQPRKSSQIERQQKEYKEKQLVCKICHHKITSERHKIEIQGHFHHTFLNPAGEIYDIGCFDQAEGCICTGVPTSEWSWFRGYEWRISLCGHCFSHLGWFYRDSQGNDFFGLILDALI